MLIKMTKVNATDMQKKIITLMAADKGRGGMSVVKISKALEKMDAGQKVFPLKLVYSKIKSGIDNKLFVPTSSGKKFLLGEEGKKLLAKAKAPPKKKSVAKKPATTAKKPAAKNTKKTPAKAKTAKKAKTPTKASKPKAAKPKKKTPKKPAAKKPVAKKTAPKKKAAAPKRR